MSYNLSKVFKLIRLMLSKKRKNIPVIAIILLLVIESTILTSAISQEKRIYNTQKHYSTQLSLNAEKISSTRIYDRRGRLLYEIIDPKAGNRTEINISDLPEYVPAAFIAAEDASFYTNPGFNIKGILRSIFYNIRSGKIVAGGSTITQQVIKNCYLSEGDLKGNPFLRKLKEIILSIWLTSTRSKDEILSQYLNTIFFGNNAYGIEAAAKIYFGKSAKQLDLAEAAVLASLPKMPSNYNPLTNPDELLERQKYVLEQMKKHNLTSRDEIIAALNEELKFHIKPYDINAPHFVMSVISDLRDIFKTDQIYSLNLDVYTTIDLELQKKAEDISKKQLQQNRNLEAQNLALVIIDVRTRELLAYIGNADFFDEKNSGSIDMAITPRQPGSAIKPITYACAFAKGWTPATFILDEESTFMTRDDKKYTPVNFDGEYHGRVTVREALANSYNIPAVKALDFVGINNFINISKKFGISEFSERLDEVGLALTLGGCEVSLLNLTNAYATIAAGGNWQNYKKILKIVDHQGNEIYEPETQSHRVFEKDGEGISFLISNILADSEARSQQFGYYSVLNVGFPAAVKTGTTTDFHDNWTIGYTPYVAVGVWIGNTDNSPMKNATGIKGAAPIWSKIIQIASERYTYRDFEIPDDIVKVRICADSGMLASIQCKNVKEEYFIKGRSPNTRCQMHTDLNVAKIGTSEANNDDTLLNEERKDINAADQNHELIKIINPGDGNIFIIDEKTPIAYQEIRLKADIDIKSDEINKIEWYCDGKIFATTDDPARMPEADWQLKIGIHSFYIQAVRKDGSVISSNRINIKVINDI